MTETGALRGSNNDLRSFSAGDIISGRIKRVESFGLFISIDNTDVVRIYLLFQFDYTLACLGLGVEGSGVGYNSPLGAMLSFSWRLGLGCKITHMLLLFFNPKGYLFQGWEVH